MESDNRFQSATIGALAAALAKAQGVMQPAAKSSSANIFKGAPGYKYADLAECLKSALAALSEHGLAIVQTTEPGDRGLILRTVLVHASGEWMASEYPLQPAQNTPQGMGSAMTYARRYALMAICGLAADDDDGAEATRPTRGETEAQRPAVAVFNGSNGQGRAPHQAVSRARTRVAKPSPVAEQGPAQEASEEYQRAMGAFYTANTPEQLMQAGAMAERLTDAVEKKAAYALWDRIAQQFSARDQQGQAARNNIVQRIQGDKPA